MSDDAINARPFRGVRVDHILPVIKRIFGETIDVRYFNGSIFQYVPDEKFINMFDHYSQAGQALFDMIATIETIMIDMGEIPPILTHIYGRKKAGTV